MRLRDKLGDRYNILILVLVILLGILVIRLSILTIAKGDYYRDVADNKRFKEIPITAPRGEIRDRNGKLIAGNKPSFTIQLFKDELDNMDDESRNESILDLIRLLEGDGVSYLDQFPLELNVFSYRTEEDYRREELKPKDKVLEIIEEHNLLGEILFLSYENPGYEDHYSFKMAEYIMQALRSKGIDIPIYMENNSLIYREDIDILEWKVENKLPESLTPLQAILKLLAEHQTVNRQVLEHPIARKLIYDSLAGKGLMANIVLEDYSLSYDEDYRNQKRELMKLYDFVSFETSGQEDFLNIFKKESLENFLLRPIGRENFRGKEVFYAPGEDLVNGLKEKDRELKFKLTIDEEAQLVNYEYLGSLNMEGRTPVEFLIYQAEKHKILDDFLNKDEIRPLAQAQLLRDGINTRISVAGEYEYSYMNSKKSLYTNIFGKKDLTMKESPKEAFLKLREKNEIDPGLSMYEARAILVINSLLSQQSHRAYQPVNIAYSLKDTTVAKVEEGMADVRGVNISIEPVRYYPEGETAAHILGYLGRISQQNEIEKYVEKNGYSPNDIIGKTGIEESFEDYLRGSNGYKSVEVDSSGKTTKVLSEKKPVPGNNIYLSIDLDLQKEAERVLRESLKGIQTGSTYQSRWGNYKFATKGGRAYKNAKSGATVAVDPNNGDILAMASYPAYDPNLFATGITSSDWASLFPENEADQLAPRPLYNIATQSSVQPGSVYKMATALTGLEKGLSPNRTIRDMGYVNIGKDEFSCYLRKSGGSHGPVDVEKALEVSCNYYFYSLALGMNQKTGESLGMRVEIDDIIDISKQFGLNDKTGLEINIPAEAHGGVPNPRLKEQGMKNMLRNFLRNNLENFVEEGTSLTKDDLEKIVEEVVSWVDKEETMTKNEVRLALVDFGINPDKKVGNRGNDLADAIKYDYLNQANWTLADTLFVTIGQGQSSYTPVQMANYIATITNGGYNNKLTLINNVKDYNNSKTIYKPERTSSRMTLKNYDHLNSLKRGMLRVSKVGTGRRTFASLPLDVGSKTGTAEKDGRIPGTNEKYDNFGWFVAFGPYENPEIAVASVVFQGGSGGNAGPMSRDIIAEYLGLNDEPKEVKEELPFENKLKQ